MYLRWDKYDRYIWVYYFYIETQRTKHIISAFNSIISFDGLEGGGNTIRAIMFYTCPPENWAKTIKADLTTEYWNINSHTNLLKIPVKVIYRYTEIPFSYSI